MAAVQDKSNNKMFLKHLRSKANEFLSSRKHANNLVEIVKHFESGSNITTCLLTLEMIFMELLKRREMYEEIIPLKPLESPDAESQYKAWLRSAYEQTWDRILIHIEQGKPAHQLQALATAMKFIQSEGRYPIETTDHQNFYFPIPRLRAVLIKMLSSDNSTMYLLNKFQEYTVYRDILFYTWRLLPPLTPRLNPCEMYIRNFLELIDKIPIPKNIEENSQSVMCCAVGKTPFVFESNTVKKWINRVWNCVMHWEHTPATHKQLLVVLLERILPHLDKPLTLTDFLMDSLDIGGPVSLLALQGIFTLIQLYNLEYPNIFVKLYSMFEPEIFHTKFKARLFYLSDLFLSSSHLPECLVAAFAKRLARLTLVAPCEDILIICLFIGNLILRHPGLKRLINHSTGGEVTSDPYIMEESDPYKSQAMDSSLWEIQTLQSHTLPNIATAARFISQPLPNVEWDLSNVLETTSDDMFEKEMKKKAKEIILNHYKPQTLAFPKNDKMSQYWQLTS